MRKCQQVQAMARELRQNGAADLTRGRWPVRCLGDRAGFWPAPVSPIWAIARVPLSNPPRPLEPLGGGGPKVLLSFAPADRRWRRRSGSGGVRAVSAARAVRRALEAVQKVVTDQDRVRKSRGDLALAAVVELGNSSVLELHNSGRGWWMGQGAAVQLADASKRQS